MSAECPGELSSLDSLDRRCLHVFVAGPGFGEGVACALPGGGWVTIDSCLAGDGRSPLRWVLDRYRGRDHEDPLCACVWTHPHEDHSEGLAEMIETLKPNRVVLGLPSPPDRKSVDRAERAWKEQRRQVVAFQDRKAVTQVMNAYRQIGEWMDEHNGTPVGVVDGGYIEVPAASGVSFQACSPTNLALQEVLGGPGGATRLRRDANLFSLVLLLTYRGTRILLGGDVPQMRSNLHSDLGWRSIVRRHRHLGHHHAQKVAHHASRRALHLALFPMATEADARTMWATPYNSSRLPSTEQRGGATWIIERGHPLLLTALSAQRQRQCAWPPPGRMSLAEFRANTAEVRTGNPLLDGAEDLRRTWDQATSSADPIWCCAFDDQGNVTGRWRGRAAVEVVP